MLKSELSELIQQVWCVDIKAVYDKGLMCSERHLQAEMYHHFKNQLRGYQCWIEPTLELQIEGSKWKIKPDILITKGHL